MYDLVNFFAVYLPDRSQCYVVSMQGHKLFPREINYLPISIWKWSLHTEISFAHLQYSLKVRNWEKTWTRDGQFSSLVRFKTTSLNWISLVMKVDTRKCKTLCCTCRMAVILQCMFHSSSSLSRFECSIFATWNFPIISIALVVV